MKKTINTYPKVIQDKNFIRRNKETLDKKSC